jgi:hypothetical protein
MKMEIPKARLSTEVQTDVDLRFAACVVVSGTRVVCHDWWYDLCDAACF